MQCRPWPRVRGELAFKLLCSPPSTYPLRTSPPCSSALGMSVLKSSGIFISASFTQHDCKSLGFLYLCALRQLARAMMGLDIMCSLSPRITFPELLDVQCLKTVSSDNLTNFIVVYNGKACKVSVNYHGQKWKSTAKTDSISSITSDIREIHRRMYVHLHNYIVLLLLCW